MSRLAPIGRMGWDESSERWFRCASIGPWERGIPMPADRWAALVDAWWMHYRLSRGGRAERKALSLGQPESAAVAAERVWEIVDAGGAGAVELLRALAGAASADDEFAYLGAGPIEDLVDIHGVVAAGQIADAARVDPQFARAVASMWIPSELASAGRELLAPWVVSGSA